MSGLNKSIAAVNPACVVGLFTSTTTSIYVDMVISYSEPMCSVQQLFNKKNLAFNETNKQTVYRTWLN